MADGASCCISRHPTPPGAERTLTRLALLTALVIAVAACGSVPNLPEWATDAPNWVASRRALPSCGEEVVDANDARYNAKARRCLLQAAERGADAEFVSATDTVDGGRLVRVYRVHADGMVEVFVRLPADRFGPQRWERHVCESLVPVEEIMGPTQLPEDEVFQPQQCESAVGLRSGIAGYRLTFMGPDAIALRAVLEAAIG